MNRSSAMIHSGLLLLLLTGPVAHGQGKRPSDINGQNAKQVPPFRIFDNLYYVGNSYVCAYVLKTSAGLIMIDTLYGEFTDHSVQEMRELGFDPKDIKYVIITHGHIDHFGGARKRGDPNPFVAPDEFNAFLQERLSDAETRLAEAKQSRNPR
jgi:glyoxylase-like metal-dependent hydrolase (beta-lactamase superfamily II)